MIRLFYQTIIFLLFELKYSTRWIPDLAHLGTYILMLHCTRKARFSASFLVLHSNSIWCYFPKRNRSEKEVRAAALVLQTIWGYKELRKPLEKEGWKKSDFQVEWLGAEAVTFLPLASGDASVFGSSVSLSHWVYFWPTSLCVKKSFIFFPPQMVPEVVLVLRCVVAQCKCWWQCWMVAFGLFFKSVSALGRSLPFSETVFPFDSVNVWYLCNRFRNTNQSHNILLCFTI